MSQPTMASPRVLSTAQPDAATLAARHGLTPVRQRPPLVRYIAELWERRDFAWNLATSSLRASNSQDRLGSLWFVLTPLLLGGIYYIVFGTILGTGSHIPNFIGYLVIGVFLWQFSSKAITEGARSLVASLTLVRALHFPRAVLPISNVLRQLLTVLPAIGVMLLLIIGASPSGVITPNWVLLAPVLALQTLFNLGLALILARATARVRDVTSALPFALRLWMYFSAVFYSLDRYVHHPALLAVLKANPLYLFLTLARDVVLYHSAGDRTQWIGAVCWAVGLVLVGLVFFWQAEETYGRD